MSDQTARPVVTARPRRQRKHLLDPVDRLSETLFGLIMAVTIVGSQSIVASGPHGARTVTVAAFGCNLAWGLVDAVMYLVRISTERAHYRAIARRAARAHEKAEAERLIAQILPTHLAALTGPEEIAGMRRHLAGLELDGRPLLRPRDWLKAAGVFAIVVISTFPVVLPFLLTGDMPVALRASRLLALAMLFGAGVGLGRFAHHVRPLLTGLCMAILGAVLIAVVTALGG